MGRRMVRDIICAQRDRGATVFLNSHLLSEIEATCDEVVFIREGEVVISRDLRNLHEDEVRVIVHARKLTQENVAGLAQWTTTTHLEGEELTITTRSRDLLPNILRHLIVTGADVFQFTPKRISLEELFLAIMGEDRGL
jgi:ABC-2 type transport system ATP-binding protein